MCFSEQRSLTPGFLLADSFYWCEVPRTRSATLAEALLVVMLGMAFEYLRKLMPKCRIMMPLCTAPWWTIGFSTITAGITPPDTKSLRHQNFQTRADIYNTSLVLCPQMAAQAGMTPQYLCLYPIHSTSQIFINSNGCGVGIAVQDEVEQLLDMSWRLSYHAYEFQGGFFFFSPIIFL